MQNATPEFSDQNEEVVFATLSTGSFHFDDLADRTGIEPGTLAATCLVLELKKLITRLPGDAYALAHTPIETESFQWSMPSGRSFGAITIDLAASLDTLQTNIRKHFHGISRKYLQPYVTLFTCLLKSSFGMQKLVGTIFEAEPITAQMLRLYKTPAAVRISVVR